MFLHVEPKLLPGEIVSLIGIPPALGGKLAAFDNFVAEIAANFNPDLHKREGPGGVCLPGPSSPGSFLRGIRVRPPVLRTKAQAGSKASVITL